MARRSSPVPTLPDDRGCGGCCTPRWTNSALLVARHPQPGPACLGAAFPHRLTWHSLSRRLTARASSSTGSARTSHPPPGPSSIPSGRIVAGGHDPPPMPLGARRLPDSSSVAITLLDLPAPLCRWKVTRRDRAVASGRPAGRQPVFGTEASQKQARWPATDPPSGGNRRGWTEPRADRFTRFRELPVQLRPSAEQPRQHI
jgi:hypothetical protein